MVTRWLPAWWWMAPSARSPSSQPAAISSGVRRAGGPAPSDDMSNSTWSAKQRLTAVQSRWSVATNSSVMTSTISCRAARVSRAVISIPEAYFTASRGVGRRGETGLRRMSLWRQRRGRVLKHEAAERGVLEHEHGRELGRGMIVRQDAFDSDRALHRRREGGLERHVPAVHVAGVGAPAEVHSEGESIE